MNIVRVISARRPRQAAFARRQLLHERASILDDSKRRKRRVAESREFNNPSGTDWNLTRSCYDTFTITELGGRTVCIRRKKRPVPSSDRGAIFEKYFYIFEPTSKAKCAEPGRPLENIDPARNARNSSISLSSDIPDADIARPLTFGNGSFPFLAILP